MDETINIIVVEDDQRLGKSLQRNLAQAGYCVTYASDSLALRRAYRQTQADLVLLDLNLGSEDGIDIARELISTTSAAVIIITGRQDVADRIEGLDAGADDYIVKPFAIDEVLARIRAVLRRRALDAAPSASIEVGQIRLDTTTQTLHRIQSSSPVLTLTETETRILGILLRDHGRAVSRERLSNRGVPDPSDRAIDVHIGNIRRKLRQVGLTEVVIGPVRGFGYRLHLEDTEGALPDQG